ncbi:MAG: acetyl-CoA carboxylase carboxyltransferase subunit alpha [Oscillospiraceae bacterium]|nr:acetyl-CoA carboxylase carboxyltransferase subunit alpha [Oscillospiraceae bacterium]MDD4413603.1 acetyl-CoA carboxylase carboxyltransferase subunit alpha [Oscillospiraceae bacterium]
MALQEAEDRIRQLDIELSRATDTATQRELQQEKSQLLAQAYGSISSFDRVYLARKTTRPGVRDYIGRIFTDFFEMHGDRLMQDDPAVIGGIAALDGMPVTVIGHCKGKTLDENIKCNFGMPNPEGYRKALRLMKQAEKFRRPIITFIDTPGAYPGLESEMHGQGEAIARNLMEMGSLTVPIITIVIGEGGSGGALALSVADRIWMLENAVYSILSPEGFASILWKDSSRAREAAELMKLTAYDLYARGIVDRLFGEPAGGVDSNSRSIYERMKNALLNELSILGRQNGRALVEQRYKKYRRIGDCTSK